MRLLRSYGVPTEVIQVRSPTTTGEVAAATGSSAAGGSGRRQRC